MGKGIGDGEKKLQQGKSGKISSGHGKIVAPFPEIVEIGGKNRRNKKRKTAAQKKKAVDGSCRLGSVSEKTFPKGK